MKNRSLGFKLITGGIAAVLIPLVIVGLFSIRKGSDALESLSRERATMVAKNLSNMVQLVLQEEVKLVTGFSVDEDFIVTATRVAEKGVEEAAAEIEQLNKKLETLMKHIGKDYESVLVTDRNGVVFSDGEGGKHEGLALTDRQYFQAAKSGKVNVADPILSRLTGQPITTACAPILSTTGDFIGSVVTVLKLDFLSDKITSVKLGQTGYPFMVDKAGLVIAHPVDKHILKTNLAKLKGMEEIMDKMLAHQTGVESYVFEGIHKIAGFSPVELTGWAIGTTQNEKEFLASSHSIRNFTICVGLVLLLVTLLAVFYFARSISQPINRAVDVMNEMSDQVASASSQISSASQSLAEGASEQASSLEEVSASLEQMSSMTRQNADNARQADTLMQEANQVISRANKSMMDVTVSMEDISRASEETSKIIKTIDEIAFQTNLLALNAAVEAARAGEAGAGFAVVADEVRNLAMRAADAAKNTAGLIEGTVKKVKEGAVLVTETNEGFNDVASSASRVGELVGEIAAASQEQAQGIEQVNKAVAEMDKVTQQTAANAEESAAACEEMNAQTEQMKAMASDLISVIGGTIRNGNGALSRASQENEEKALAPTNGNHGKLPVKRGLKNYGLIRPEKVIPMDENDFRDF